MTNRYGPHLSRLLNVPGKLCGTRAFSGPALGIIELMANDRARLINDLPPDSDGRGHAVPADVSSELMEQTPMPHHRPR
jgi:hypothetical protein